MIWKDVQTELPENGKPLAVVIKIRNTFDPRVPIVAARVGTFDRGFGWKIGDRPEEDYSVTHWAYLPEWPEK